MSELQVEALRAAAQENLDRLKREASAHRTTLESLGFPEAAIHEAVAAVEAGLFEIEPTPEMIAETARAAGERAAREANEHKMWLAVRVDLPLSIGKALIHSGHCFGRLYLSASQLVPERMDAYLSDNEPKIGVKAKNEGVLHRIADECERAGIPHQLVRDAGRSEVPAGTPIYCAFGPWKRAELPKFLHKLQKLKDEDFPRARLKDAEPGDAEPDDSE